MNAILGELRDAVRRIFLGDYFFYKRICSHLTMLTFLMRNAEFGMRNCF